MAPAAPEHGLVQSLLIKAQRAELDEIGRRVGTPVLYLKAAWADPVLYGGRGVRTGTDVDVLVDAGRFADFARALEAAGFTRYQHGSPAYERYFGHKEWAFLPPAGQLSVDLHRALTEPIWFDLPTADLIQRALAWPSVDGPILSLALEDQLLYGAAHYANHDYDLDDRHLTDCQHLVERYPVDWDLLAARARRANLRLPLLLLLETLAHRGAPLPAEAAGKPGLLLGLRRALAGRWIETVPELRRRTARRRALDYLVLKPLLSDRPTALARVCATYGLPWLQERLQERLRDSPARRPSRSGPTPAGKS